MRRTDSSHTLPSRDVTKNLSLRLDRLRALACRIETIRHGDRRREGLTEELRVAIADVRHARVLAGGPSRGEARVERRPEVSGGI